MPDYLKKYLIAARVQEPSEWYKITTQLKLSTNKEEEPQQPSTSTSTPVKKFNSNSSKAHQYQPFPRTAAATHHQQEPHKSINQPPYPCKICASHQLPNQIHFHRDSHLRTIIIRSASIQINPLCNFNSFDIPTTNVKLIDPNSNPITDSNPFHSMRQPCSITNYNSYLDLSKVDINPNFSNQTISDILHKYKNVFSKHNFDIGHIKTNPICISLLDNIPISQKPYRTYFYNNAEIQKQITELLKYDIIRPSSSPYSSPALLVNKKSDAPNHPTRLCIDYRKLNQKTVPEHTPIPLIEQIINRLSQSKIYTILDVKNAYWHIPIDEKDRHKTSFVTQLGCYEWNRLPYGLKNAPSQFERIMKSVFTKHNIHYALNYFDDIIIHSKTYEEHIKHLDDILGTFEQEDIKLNLNKCKFLQKEIQFLGYTINSGKYTPNNTNIEAILKLNRPYNIKTLQRFLGTINIYNKFIPHYAQIRAPLNELLLKNAPWLWSAKHEQAFQTLKNSLISQPVLYIYDPSKPCHLFTDASSLGVAGVLKQPDEQGILHPIGYFSRKLHPYEQNYTASEIETLAIINSVQRFHTYLHNIHFTLHTDHLPLKWIKNVKNPQGRLFRWSSILSQYRFDIKHNKRLNNIEADMLSRAPVSFYLTYNELKEHQSTEQISSAKIKIQNGLYIINRKGFKRAYVPQTLRHKLLSKVHTQHGHIGTTQMTKIISPHYYWSHMTRDIANYTKHCETCQFNKSRDNRIVYGPLQQMPIATHPNHIFSLDTLGGLHNYGTTRHSIHMIVDHHSRFLWAFPTKSVSTDSYITCLRNLFQINKPEILITDRNAAFLSRKFKHFLERNNVKHLLTSSHHPETNAKVERLNSTIINRLRCEYNANLKIPWTKYIPKITESYNETVHTTTGFTPKFLYYGIQPQYIEHDTVTHTPIEKARKLAIERTIKSHEHSKQLYDIKHPEPIFKEGDQVLVKTFIYPNTGKLTQRYIGPFTILKQLSPVTYEINKSNLPQRKQTEIIHSNKLKLFYPETDFLLHYSTNIENDFIVNQNSNTKLIDIDDKPYHGNFGKFLATIGAVKEPGCFCGGEIQDARHLLLECPIFQDFRENRFGRIGQLDEFVDKKEKSKNTNSCKVRQIVGSPEPEMIQEFVIQSVENTNLTEDWYEEVKIKGKKANMKLDTGAQCNVLPLSLAGRLNLDIQRSPVKSLISFSGHRIPVEGQSLAMCMVKNMTAYICFIISRDNTCPILGRQTCSNLGLVKRVNTCQAITQEYQELFEGIGCLKGYEYEAKFQISDMNMQVRPPRPIPLSIKERVKKELEELEDNGIIKKLNYPTPISSQMVIAKQKEKISICIDPSDINKVILRSHFPLQTFDQIAVNLHGSKYFTKLDLKKGYWQFKVAPNSQRYFTFSTPWGRYMFLRVPFGIKTAPEIFQKIMADLLQDLEGTENSMDDILIHAPDPQTLEIRTRAIQQYDLRIKYKKGKELLTADLLSRDCSYEDTYLEKNFEVLMTTPTNKSSYEELQALTKEDQELQELKHLILYGWPNYKSAVPESCKKYWPCRDELSTNEDLIFNGSIVFILLKWKAKILKLIHEGHQGTNSCLRRARDSIYWHGMSQDIINTVEICRTCQANQRNKTKEPMIIKEIPSLPWEIVAADIFSIKGKNYQLINNNYSGFIDFKEMKTMNFTETIESLKKWFGVHGIPSLLEIDNGPNFTSRDFKGFQKKWLFDHQTSSPLYPNINGLAERAVQTAKNLIRKCLDSGQEVELALLNFYNTPRDGLPSPAQCLFSRRTRTLLPTSTHQLEPEIQKGHTQNLRNKREKQKTHHDKTAKTTRSFKEGEKIMLKQHHREWIPARVTQEVAPRSYKVQTPTAEYRRNSSFMRHTNLKSPKQQRRRIPEIPKSTLPEGPGPSGDKEQAQVPEELNTSPRPFTGQEPRSYHLNAEHKNGTLSITTRMVETRSGKMQDPAQERIKAEESAKPQLGATIGGDASSDPVVLNPNIDIPKYDGTEDPRPWIESLEEIGSLYHWADYIIARYAAMNMTGSAKTWLNLHKASFTSWENIKIRLIQDFSLDANKEELRMKLNRMQHWNEPAIRFAEDILVLCNKVDPAMEEETKIDHVIGGLKKEYSFALYLNPPKTTDELLVVCKKMDSFEKKYRERVEKSRNLYNGPRYSRPQQQSRYEPPTATRNYQTPSRPQAPVSNNYKNDFPPTLRQYRNNLTQPFTPRRPYNPNFVPKPNLQREVSKNRTEDGRPICFKCNKPGHVARYCRVKFIRILEEDPTATQEKIEEKCQMNEISDKSGPRLYADASIEAEDGEYVIEENNRMIQTNGLRLARSLLTVTDRKTHIWITNPYPRPLKIMKDQTLAHGSLPAEGEPKERDIIKDQIDEMLKEGIIRPSSSPWSFPVILVKKRDGKFRFCVDYRKLNEVTVKDVYPIPRIDDVMDILQGSKYFSAIDLRSGYWQVEIEEKDKEKTAFTTTHGLYEFNVMPFGLCNAPATFERNMDNVLGNLRWQICLCYLDDVIIYSSDFPTHLKRLEAVLKCFSESNLKLNDRKCRFAFEELEILGHITNQQGIKPAEYNIKAVRDFPQPKKVKEVQSFLGMCSYYRKFIKDFSLIADPLTGLIRKNAQFTWTEKQEEAFQNLKKALINPPILGHFDPNAATYKHTDASNIGLGATLVQIICGEEKVISYLSRTLSKAEQNYSTTEKECLAVVWAISKLRPYLYGRHFKIITDHHALCWLKNLKDPTGRLARWALKIQEYDFDIIHKSGKKHMDADGLSRGPLPETDWVEDYERLFLNQIINEEDEFIENVKKSLKGSKRAITQNFKEENGCLYKKNPNPEGRAWLLVVPKKRRKEIMSEFHNHMLNGHLGVARTTYRLKNKYHWPSMLKDVSEFVKTCHLCQSRKGSNQSPSGLLQPIPPANYPFERIGIDFVGPLPSTKRRRKWIIVLTDYYTRYAETKAVSEATVKEVSTFLIEQIFLRHGAPRFLISDRGSQFTSNLMKEVMKMCKVKHCFTTSYHPQTNGLTERLNRTLINMISMYVNTDQKNWDEILPFVTHAYNTTIQETTGYSPFFLLFGRKPMSLLDDDNMPIDNNMNDYDEYIENCLDKIARTRQVVINNTEKTQERMKRNYDKKHNERIYEPGHLVAVWTPVRKIGKCEKLLKKYFGPYRILKKLSNVNYLIEPKNNPGQDPLIVHVSRLKPYFERIDEVTHED
ncbi:hypothetical protein LAZ67_5003162, partial [Cordylochernes scorpioides]